MNPVEKFNLERQKNIEALADDAEIQEAGLALLCHGAEHNYSFNFDWLSRPIIQHPQDIVAFQEIVWRVKPDLIIETGIAHGGSAILSASLLALLDLCQFGHASTATHPDLKRRVIAIDIDIRSHNRSALEAHPLYPRITLLEGSSVSQSIIDSVKEQASGHEKVMVCLDSNHTHEHVLAELENYAPLTTVGSYCVVFDTIIEDMPKHMFENDTWSPGNSPKTAVHEYLKTHPEFEPDKSISEKLLLTVAPDGYLKRIG